MDMQYHLRGKGFSGRAVRVRELDPIEVEDNLKAAAKIVGEGGDAIEIKKTEWRNGVKLMVTEFSDPCEDPMAPDVKWRKVAAGMLDDLGTYFKAKDVAVLEAIYRENHEVLQSEVEAIVGKALPVSGG